jgi:uncharacterized protein
MTPNRLMAGLAVTLSLAAASSSPMAQTKQELVAKVLLLQQPGIEALGNTLAGNTANQVMQVVARAMGRVPADKREAVAKDLQGEVRKFYDDVSPQLRAAAVRLAPSTIGASYEEKFTEDELKTLIAWLESPVNKKFQQTAQEMQQGLGTKLVAETKAQVEPKLKALEQRLSGKIDAAAGPAAAASGSKPAAPKK